MNNNKNITKILLKELEYAYKRGFEDGFVCGTGRKPSKEILDIIRISATKAKDKIIKAWIKTS
jgi:hypothetical protein